MESKLNNRNLSLLLVISGSVKRPGRVRAALRWAGELEVETGLSYRRHTIDIYPQKTLGHAGLCIRMDRYSLLIYTRVKE